MNSLDTQWIAIQFRCEYITSKDHTSHTRVGFKSIQSKHCVVLTSLLCVSWSVSGNKTQFVMNTYSIANSHISWCLKLSTCLYSTSLYLRGIKCYPYMRTMYHNSVKAKRMNTCSKTLLNHHNPFPFFFTNRRVVGYSPLYSDRLYFKLAVCLSVINLPAYPHWRADYGPVIRWYLSWPIHELMSWLLLSLMSSPWSLFHSLVNWRRELAMNRLDPRWHHLRKHMFVSKANADVALVSVLGFWCVMWGIWAR